MENDDNSKTGTAALSSVSRFKYRKVSPTDILKCAEIGKPRCTKRELQYWQHHASPYFICAVLHEEDSDDNDDNDDNENDNAPRNDNDTLNHVKSGSVSNISDRNSISSNSSSIKSNTTDDADHDHHHHHDDDDHHHDEDDIILGFISGVRLDDENSYGPNDEMLVEKTSHKPNGKILSIRSITVTDDDSHDDDNSSNTNTNVTNNAERKKKMTERNLSQSMLQHYVSKMKHLNRTTTGKDGVNNINGGSQHSDRRRPIQKIVALCSTSSLPMYLECGFHATRLSRAIKSVDVSDENHRTGGYNFPESEHVFYVELSLPSVIPKKEETRQVSLTDGPRCYIVDSFTTQPGAGNPAAVVVLREGFDPDRRQNMKWMQKVAAEFNLAETAFCWPQQQKPSSGETKDQKNQLKYNIRYYTPTVEMPLCGHATLATAAILYQTLSISSPSPEIVFQATEDVLTMRQAENKTDVMKDNDLTSRISMDFPPKPAKELTTRDDRLAVRNMLTSAFGGGVDFESDTLFIGCSDLGDLLIELKPKAFSDIGYDSLNFKAFLEWDGYFRGVVICCLPSNDDVVKSSNDNVDFLSRFFAPKAGINEDDVTGSAHCILGPYFAKKLKKDRVIGRQVSKRSGVIECHVRPDCVTLTGSAVVTMSGFLHI